MRFKVLTLTVCSWGAAIALLWIALHFLAVTPGYLPDHLE
jgi:hypothetical protein